MLNWLKGHRNSVELPHYSRLKANPAFAPPPDRVERETGEAYRARSDLLAKELMAPARRPPDDAPLFIELAGDRGVVTIPLPDGGGQCLPVFTSPARAGDYVRTLLVSGPRAQYLSSSPTQLVGMLGDLRRVGVASFTVDRCPRCNIFVGLGSDGIQTAADAIMAWATSKCIELTRADLYFEHALDSARSGRFEAARDLALETVGHVRMEDPRPHLLLGQLAVELRDRTLLKEAKAFLRYFGQVLWEKKLDEIERSGRSDFA